MSATHPRDQASSLVASGPVPASVMVFGEAPLAGRGSAVSRPDPGELLLRRALADVGIEPEAVRFLSVAKREVVEAGGAGTPAWVALLLVEVRRVQPRVLVLLGSSAGRTMLGARFATRRQRGCILPAPREFELAGAPALLVTAHPSTVHRSRHRAFDYAAMVDDLRVAADRVSAPGPGRGECSPLPGPGKGP